MGRPQTKVSDPSLHNISLECTNHFSLHSVRRSSTVPSLDPPSAVCTNLSLEWAESSLSTIDTSGPSRKILFYYSRTHPDTNSGCIPCLWFPLSSPHNFFSRIFIVPYSFLSLYLRVPYTPKTDPKDVDLSSTIQDPRVSFFNFFVVKNLIVRSTYLLYICVPVYLL